MKKLFTVVVSLIMALSLSACTVAKGDADYTIGIVDGAPSLAVATFYEGYTVEGQDKKVKMGTEIKGDASVIIAGLSNGTYDMAVLPLNVGAKLYNKGLDIKLASVNIFGVLYMVGSQTINNINELKGQVVYNIGKGGTPDLTFKCLLEANGIEYEESDTVTDKNKVYLQYVSASSELIPLLKIGTAKFAIMGEPVVTQANKVAGCQIVLDIQAEWQKIYGNETNYVQAGVFVSKNIYGDKTLLKNILTILGDNNQYISKNIDNMVDILKANGSALSVTINQEVVNRCNIDCVKASDAKVDVEAYFTAIKAFDPTFIGGNLPDSNFYL